MSKTKAQLKRNNNKQDLVNWARHNRSVLILASALVPVLYLLVLGAIERGKGTPISLLLSAFVLLACTLLIVALARIVELLGAIRSELVMIRGHIDRGLLDDIATDLTAVRTQMDKGVIGLLGM